MVGSHGTRGQAEALGVVISEWEGQCREELWILALQMDCWNFRELGGSAFPMECQSSLSFV